MRATAQIFRCYTVPDEEEKSGKKGRKKKAVKKTALELEVEARINEVDPAWPGPKLILDWETLPGALMGQRGRFGIYQFRRMKYNDRMRAIDAELKSGLNLLTIDMLDRLEDEGLVYGEWCTEAEIEILRQYAKEQKLSFMSLEEFVIGVFYKPQWIKYGATPKERLKEKLLVIGFNLPFDLGAMCQPDRSGLARGKNYGGLLLHLLKEKDPKAPSPTEATEKKECWGDPSIMIKRIGFAKHIMKANPPWIEFLDCQTLGLALGGPGDLSMRAMLRRFNVDKEFQKNTEGIDYDGPITPAYIGYCRDDVMNTWQLYVKQRARYIQWGISRPIWRLYSAASAGKALYVDCGVTWFLKKPTKKDRRKGPGIDFDPRDIGAAMEGYYGGRSHANIRQLPVKGVHCDFKSEYPTANAIKKLQRFLIANRVEMIDDRPETLSFLRTVELADLQRKETWTKLCGWALVTPGPDTILPFRTGYESVDEATGEVIECTCNIGINKVRSACPAWYTFDDIIVSKLLTGEPSARFEMEPGHASGSIERADRRGRLPKILHTKELSAQGRQRSLKKFCLFGDPNYAIDLSKGNDFFTRVIELRIKVDTQKDAAEFGSDKYFYYDALQTALKILANSTSYGVLVEAIVDEHENEVGTTVYHGGDVTRVTACKRSIGADGKDQISDYKVERPGKFFSPVGGLVPAAGRLMLGIAERLAADRGLTFAFCDTDSMFFVDLEGKYTAVEFYAKVQEITDWFQPLNPYRKLNEDGRLMPDDSVRIFNYEKANFKLKDDTSGKATKEFDELWCLAISAKRYVLYNRRILSDGSIQIVIRKATAHGLGDISKIVGYDAGANEWTAADHIAAPMKDDGTRNYSALINSGANARPFLDLWRLAIEEFERFIARGSDLDSDFRPGFVVDKFLPMMPGFNEPKVTQTVLSTKHTWLSYDGLPNRRPFQFFLTLGKLQPGANPGRGIPSDERKKLMETSLYAAYQKDFRLKTLAEYEAMGEGNEGLYLRGSNKFPKEAFNPKYHLHFQTVAERMEHYFNHGEAKSHGDVGLLERAYVIGLTKEWTGKESHPLQSVDDNPDDDVSMEETAYGGIILTGGFNVGLIREAGVEAVAKAARIDLERLKKILREGRKPAAEIVEKIAHVIFARQDGSLEVRALPESNKESKKEKVRHALIKCGRFAEVAAVINPDHEKDQLIIDGIERSALHHDLSFFAKDGTEPYGVKLAAVEKAVGAVSGADRKIARQAASLKRVMAVREASQGRLEAVNIRRQAYIDSDPWLHEHGPGDWERGRASRPRKTSSTGIPGVTKCGKKWIPRCRIGKIDQKLGVFDTFEEAVEARDLAEVLNKGMNAVLYGKMLGYVDMMPPPDIEKLIIEQEKCTAPKQPVVIEGKTKMINVINDVPLTSPKLQEALTAYKRTDWNSLLRTYGNLSDDIKKKFSPNKTPSRSVVITALLNAGGPPVKLTATRIGSRYKTVCEREPSWNDSP
jgi:hypothetical protein